MLTLHTLQVTIRECQPPIFITAVSDEKKTNNGSTETSILSGSKVRTTSDEKRNGGIRFHVRLRVDNFRAEHPEKIFKTGEWFAPQGWLCVSNEYAAILDGVKFGQHGDEEIDASTLSVLRGDFHGWLESDRLMHQRRAQRVVHPKGY